MIMRRTFFCLIWLILASFSTAEERTITFNIDADLGTDLGQSFGSLFELKDSKGRVVIGAGFQDVYNTRSRNARLTLQFYVRPPAGDARQQIARLPHPDLDCGVFLFDHNSSVYCWSGVGPNGVRKWDSQKKKWLRQHPPTTKVIRNGDGVMNLGDGLLAFTNNQVLFNGKVILKSKHTDYCYYYAHGHLFFFRRVAKDNKTYIYACPWKPGEAKVDITKAIRMTAKYPRETPFAWGQFNKQVLTVSNYGGVHVFDKGKWTTIVEGSDKTSYQVYSMIRLYDRLLLAQYPTGNVFEYRGKGVPKQLKGFPPKLKGVSGSARECQTLSIYRGELFAGVWPWAEVWRYDVDGKKWTFVRRGFSHPKLTDKMVHPYEQHTERFRLVRNHWGQRITSMIPLGESLYMSTSSKGTYKWYDKYKFLTEQQRREYGAVMALKLFGNLAVPLKWNKGRLQLKLTVADDGVMAVYQNGKKLAQTNFKPTKRLDLGNEEPTFGKGIFGPFSGKLRATDVDVVTK